MSLISKILSISISLRVIILSFGALLIAVEKEFDGFIYDKLNINNPVYIENDLLQYYEKFKLLERLNERYSAKRGLVLLMSDSFLKEERTVGYCIVKTYPEKLVVINKKFWDKYSDIQREIAVFHELGHCLYRQNHRDNSIMQAYILDEKKYVEYYNQYIIDLFSH